MRRRDFLTTLAGAAAWPLAVSAQPRALPVIGFLSSGSADSFAGRLRAFKEGLGEAGFIDGRNAVIEFRWAEGQYDKMAGLAAELVRLNVAVIFASNGIDAPIAKAATRTTPIVFNTAGDPVAAGLVASLNRPGGNLTGVTNLSLEVGQKRLELLHEMAPGASNVAFLANPTNPNLQPSTHDIQVAADTFGLKLHVLRASTEGEFDAVFAAIARLRPAALLIGPDPFLSSRNDQLAVLAIRHGVPAISSRAEFPAAGGLMSYGGSIAESYRLAGAYVGRILKGDKPADLPVQQATKIELIINLNTARALGITVPITLLGRADQVIE